VIVFGRFHGVAGIRTQASAKLPNQLLNRFFGQPKAEIGLKAKEK
jgi:hypothetical protein